MPGVDYLDSNRNWQSAGVSAGLPVTLSTTISGEDQTLGAMGVINAASEYETVAASQSDQALGATGATGDYLHRLILVVATAATAATSIKDGGGSAISVFPNSPGGGVGTYTIEVGLKSLAGAWKVTTGAGVSVIAIGNFT